MNNRIESSDKGIPIANNNSNDNIEILKNISVKERPFSPSSPSTFEKGVYVDVIENRENDWSLVTIDLEN